MHPQVLLNLFCLEAFSESEPDSVETGVLGTPDAGYTAGGWRLSKQDSYCGGGDLLLLNLVIHVLFGSRKCGFRNVEQEARNWW